MQRSELRRPFSAERRHRQPLNGTRVEGAEIDRTWSRQVLESIARIEDLLGLPGAVPGRCFSAERSRVAPDHAGALQRLHRIHAALGAAPPTDGEVTAFPQDGAATDADAAERERRMHETQVQIAHIRSDPAAGDLKAAVAQTAAIVETTEEAANAILDSVEQIERVMEEIRVTTKDISLHERLDEIQEGATRIVAATNFQDLTGQRAGKVHRTLEFVDQRLAQIADIWGPTAFEDLAPAPADQDLVMQMRFNKFRQMGNTTLTVDHSEESREE